MTEIGGTMSHYKILEKLGEGGMGVVYRAEDANLSRQVAIKVLPDLFSGDAERLARFEREARLLASLNHPNIATIHGLEQAEGKRFLVMELVEGETLAQRLLKEPLPVEEALEVCRQVAEGIEAAHEKGVIHRDLKPANIKITPEGKVKILDFGLAKAFQEETAAADLSQSPTLTAAMTRAGVILGTAAYMSPEQAKGKPVDKRTDIWAFGCILCECLTGKPAFEGETISETLASVLKGEPNWDLLPVATPWKADDVILFSLNADGTIDQARMKAVSPATNFSFDFQDLLLRPVRTKLNTIIANYYRCTRLQATAGGCEGEKNERTLHAVRPGFGYRVAGSPRGRRDAATAVHESRDPRRDVLHQRAADLRGAKLEWASHRRPADEQPHGAGYL